MGKAEEILWKCAAFMVVRIFFAQSLMMETDHVRLGEICLSSTLKKSGNESQEMINCKVLLLKGTARDVTNRVYTAPALIDSLDTYSLEKINMVTVNQMRVTFYKSVALFFDGKGCPFMDSMENIANNLDEDSGNMSRQESLGLIYVKGSEESRRTQLQGLRRG